MPNASDVLFSRRVYFRKFPHFLNFEFIRRVDRRGSARAGRSGLHIEFRQFGNGICRLRLRGPWQSVPLLSGLDPRRPKRGSAPVYEASMDATGAVAVRAPDGAEVFSAPAGSAIGVSGSATVFLFERRDDDRFYGMGEKLLGLELSGRQSKFWNTDAFADFHWKEVFEDRPDPYYASIPYLIVHRGRHWIGLLLDNPQATFIHTGASFPDGSGSAAPRIALGAESGASDLYVIAAESLPELTRLYQTLVGRTPLPPVWALGYHQCRWGYQSESDLLELDGKFREHGIPCDGLWIDIDYMQSFKVFTVDPKHFPDFGAAVKRLEENGRKVIPILDPGVKREPGYSIYDDGQKHDIFCRNPQGGEFVGQVWPGDTVFPDFSLPEGRKWWAENVRKFAAAGIRGAWIDMNDPSTGFVQNDAMRFQKGRLPHDAFHNQYALGMAIATREGFAAAHPGRRPFVISRSGYVGIGKYAAIWTGDNCSNYHYLKLAIPCTLNLALSGVPFNGPDIGGFAGDTSPQLLRDWQKACFLFPFCRNHSAKGTRRQEPWAFDRLTLRVVRHYIRLRYKLRPYLYNLFIRHEEDGDAIIRPLFYDFDSTTDFPLDRIEDEFMIGPAILQAPILDGERRTRDVILPGPAAWWSAIDSRWIEAPCRLTVSPTEEQTPLYVREGSILPMSVGEPVDNRWNPLEIEAHIFLRNRDGAQASATYTCDDGDTDGYRSGQRSSVVIRAEVHGRDLVVQTETIEDGFGIGSIALVLYDRFSRVFFDGAPVRLVSKSWRFCGTLQRVRASAAPLGRG
ncbi:MAG: glycoside hydrolase family 31 protein [Kiritimatiellae bacterium]|nr:glycoside hydrolase family 31 protein [Kiritimatiellia bacterium]MDW8458957.1 glycoside hydrolase family 31 protein [Verrucomicrobiota bacterium]